METLDFWRVIYYMGIGAVFAVIGYIKGYAKGSKEGHVSGYTQAVLDYGAWDQISSRFVKLKDYGLEKSMNPEVSTCQHSWTEERAPEWRSHCRKCGLQAQGSCQG